MTFKTQLSLALALIAIPLFSIAQNKTNKASMLWGKEYKASKKSTMDDIVGYDDEGIYALKVEYKKMGLVSEETLERYDYNMNLSTSLSLGDIEFAVFQNGQIFVFYSEKSRSTKLNSLYSQSVNMKSMTLNNDKSLVGQINFSGHSKLNSGFYSYELSNDNSKLFVNYHMPYEKHSPEEFGFFVFDDNLNLLWGKNVILPYDEGLFEIDDFEVDNEGNVHVVGVAFNSYTKRLFHSYQKVKKKGKPNYKYHILSYTNEGESTHDNTVSLDDKFITDLKVAVDSDLNVQCGGFYSSIGTFSIEGCFYLELDGSTHEILTESYEDFGIDFITQNMTDTQEKKAKKKAKKGKTVEMYEYDLDDLIIKEDGGAYLIGEQYFVRVVTTTTTSANGGATTTTNYFYTYNDIIAISISSDGKIEWTEKIGKYQSTSNDGGFFSSYSLSVVDDKLYFVFNDNPKNLFYNGEGKIHRFYGGKETAVVLAMVDGEGGHTREALFTAKEADIMTRPKVCEQISENQTVIFGQRRKTQRLGLMTIGE